MSTQPIYAIKDKAPEFPCWLWGTVSRGWIRFQESEMHRNHEYGEPLWTHWHPDAPTAPTARPQAEVSQGAYGVRIEQTPTGFVRHSVKQPEKPKQIGDGVPEWAKAYQQWSAEACSVNMHTEEEAFKAGAEWRTRHAPADSKTVTIKVEHAPTVPPPSREAELREALSQLVVWADTMMMAYTHPFLNDTAIYKARAALASHSEPAQPASAPATQPGPSDAWTQTPPSEQGTYWHWNGDQDSSPLPIFVLYSGFTGKCFVSMGQLGINHATDCDEYGGWWKPLRTPKTPEQEELDAIRAAMQSTEGRS